MKGSKRMNKRDTHMFELAKSESLLSDYKGYSNVKIGCVVSYNGSIIARGHNTDKTSTIQSRYNCLRYAESPTRYFAAKGHAEILALTKIKYLDIDFSKVKVFVYRETKNGKPAMARPCPSCTGFIKELGIKKIYYTTDCGFAYEELKYD